MQNSDLKNVLIAAIENADNRLLSMLYAVTKSYQITENKSSTPVQESVDSPEPIATAQSERKYKDDRPRRVVRVYRKPQTKIVNEVVKPKPVVANKAATEVAQPVITSKVVVEPTAKSIKESVVSGRSNNGGFISDLMTKTVSKSALPA